MERHWDDLRVSFRTLRKSKAFAFAVISALSIGLALEIVVISVVNAYLVRSLPYPDADRLYRVAYAQPGQSPPAGLEHLDWQSLSTVVEHPISWDLDAFYLIGGEHAERALGAWVTSGFMRGLGIQPAVGRAFTAEEFSTGGPQVALISNDLWMSRFGGDTAAIGRRFQAYTSDRPRDPETFTIVGVLPPNFWHLNTYTQILTPLRAPSYPYLVRLRANTPAVVAERRIMELMRGGHVDLPAGASVRLQSLQAEYASRVRPLLRAIGVAVTLVMLIACSNAALLMLLRGLQRRREVALRLALGATAGRIARMLLAESIILVGAATVVGASLAAIVIRSLAPVIEHQLGRRVPGGVSAISIDARVLGVITALALLMMLLLSLAPFVANARHALFSSMRQGRPIGAAGSRGRRTRFALIALEVAGSFALLVGCGLMARTLKRMVDVDLGFDPRNVVTAQLAIREQTYPDVDSRLAFYERVLDALAGEALSTPSPVASFEPRSLVEVGSVHARVSLRMVTPAYFTTLRTPIVAGRSFTAADRGSSEPVAIISASLARQLWPGGAPLGKRMRMATSPDDSTAITRTVVGVASDSRQSPIDQALADAYVPFLQVPPRFAAVVRRTSEPLPVWTAGLRRAVTAIDPTVAVGSPERLGDTIEDQLGRPRFLATLFAAFGVFASALGVMGLYTVIASAVKQREREIAVRVALGASARSIVGLCAREGVMIMLTGLLTGAVGVVGIGRLLEAQLFGVQPLDLATVGVTAFGLAAACVAACTLPARRAGRIDPNVALKAE